MKDNNLWIYKDLLYSKAMELTRNDHHMADDLVQTTFLKTLNRIAIIIQSHGNNKKARTNGDVLWKISRND